MWTVKPDCTSFLKLSNLHVATPLSILVSKQNNNYSKYGDLMIKMENSLLVIFPKFWPRPCTIVQGLLPDFGATLKIHKKSNFDWNQLKLSTQHMNMYMYQKKL